MYANETRGEYFPPGMLYRESSRGNEAEGMFQSYNAAAFYPDYWTDPAIAICPSDNRQEMATTRATIEDDFSAQIRRIAQSPYGAEWERNICMMHLLSQPISYYYFAHVVRTGSEITRIGQAAYDQLRLPGFYHNTLSTNLTHVDPSCTADVGYFVLPSGRRYMQEDFSSAEYDTQYDSWALNDDGQQLIGTTWTSRLRDGIERFFITDINNPAAGAQAQSQIVVMQDTIGQDAHEVWGGGTFQFNHAPSGSNVLYMDGHVRFVRLDDAPPMLYKTLDFNSFAAWGKHPPEQMANPMIMRIWARMGGAG